MESRKAVKTGEEKERAILVSIRRSETGLEEAEESLQELCSLVETAGASVIETMLQARSKPDPATLMGKGKLEELSCLVEEKDADLVVFDQELTPSQQRNLENELHLKVVDRTALILDIFSLHAHSKEGKAQVEMAQLRYGLTRLTGKGAELSRLGGGIGTRGPGETKLEVDRRRINTRIRTLDRELKVLARVRKVKRKRRDRQSIPTFALVGYTNAGKSSLLNALTDANVVVEDQLFSTLDTITRRILLPGNRRAVISDTVGFINHLPHQLVEAFKSTLEEVKDADILLHIIDATTSNIKVKMDAVDEVLAELGASDIPAIFVLSKVDLLEEDERSDILKVIPYAVATSATTGKGLRHLRERMSSTLSTMILAHLFIPFQKGELLTPIYRLGQVLSFRGDEEGYYMVVSLPESLYHNYQEYVLDDEAQAIRRKRTTKNSEP